MIRLFRASAFLLIPAALIILFPMDFDSARPLITFPASQFEPWFQKATGPAFNPDCLQSYYPRRVFAANALREGRLPLWDPYSFCGQPFLANFQAGVFYPVNLLLTPFSPERQMGLFVWLHLLIAGLGGAVFMRSLGVSTGAAVVGGLLFATSGSLAVRTGQSTMLASAAWFPLLLFLAGRAVERKSWVLSGVGFACFILSGFPPIVAWGALLAVAWGIWLWIPIRKESGVAPLVCLIGSFLLGTALAAIQLMPTAEFIMQTDRIRFPYSTLLSSSWHPVALLRQLIPDYFGTPFTGGDWLHLLKRGDGHYYQSFISTAAYVGIGGLLLFTIGAGRWRDHRAIPFFLVTGGVSLLLLLGTPVLRIVSAMPGLGGARVDRVIHIPVLALCVIAAFGLDRLGRGGRGRITGQVFPLFLGIVVLVAYLLRRKLAFALVGPSAIDLVAPIGLSVMLSGVMLVAFLAIFRWAPFLKRAGLLIPAIGLLLIADTGLQARRCHVTAGENGLPHETDEIRFLTGRAQGEGGGEEGRIVRFKDEILPPNLPGIFGIRDVAGYNALSIKWYRRYFANMAGSAVKERRINPVTALLSINSPLLDRLGARFILTGTDDYGLDRPVLYNGRVRILDNPTAYPRAYLTYQVVNLEKPAQAYAILSHPQTPRFTATIERREIVLEPDDKSLLRIKDWIAPEGSPVPATSFGPEESIGDDVRFMVDEPERITIDCASQGGRLLVLSDTWYPGWKAWVDGVESPLYRVNRIFRGVVLPRGVHRVEFRYLPRSFAAGRLISGIALVITLVGAALSLLTRRSRGSIRTV